MRKILLVAAILLFAISAFSQRFQGGILTGFNGSQIRGDLSYGFHKLGFVGGVWVQTNINEKFYWSSELKYSQKGSRINPNAKNDYWLYIYRLNYIDLPVLVGYRVQNYISIFGGVSFGYLISKSGENSYGDDPTVTYSDLKSSEIGLFTGVKVNFDRLVNRDWAKRFILDLRYQFSAISIYSGNDLFFYYSYYGQFNSVISTSLYYTIDLGSGKNY